ncbi:MAG TPA: hypothetical protein VLC28_04530 [Flavitalea sp.]|nr:hypothetical protein [Flavitalea sp.]
MQSNLILFFLVAVVVVLVTIQLNKWLLKWINPRLSGARLILYFLVVLAAGFLLTFAFSHLMLSLFFRRK